MSRILMILEVSRKQDYIFSRKELRENAARSAVIRHVTDSAFFQQTAGALYSEQENLVYSGGGHTVLQFTDRRQATDFAACVTGAAMRNYNGLELFVKQMEYDEGRTPGENLVELSRALERKKSLRRPSFRRTALGVETLDQLTYRAEPIGSGDLAGTEGAELAPPAGWRYPARFDQLAGEENFIAVVSADGNAMGKRVSRIYQSAAASWETCCQRLDRFSRSIQRDFEQAFTEMTREIIRLKGQELESGRLPVRPIILAGDDVCFAARGSLGLECARIFLEKLSHLTNEEDGRHYAACAGVVLVHTKYPFHRACDMAEELCKNAKRFGSTLRSDGSIAAMDWHIEFGQLQDSLSRQRLDYETEDGGRLELRPVTVVVPEDLPETEETAFRSYAFFRRMSGMLRNRSGKIGRSKIKEMRTAMKQGRKETVFFLRDRQVGDLFGGADNIEMSRRPFRRLGNRDRCLFFDAVELLDHCEFLEEVE